MLAVVAVESWVLNRDGAQRRMLVGQEQEGTGSMVLGQEVVGWVEEGGREEMKEVLAMS